MKLKIKIPVSLAPEEIRLRSEIIEEYEKIVALTKPGKERDEITVSLLGKIVIERISSLQKTLNELKLIRRNLENTR